MGDIGRIVRRRLFARRVARRALRKEAAFRQETVLFALLATRGLARPHRHRARVADRQPDAGVDRRVAELGDRGDHGPHRPQTPQAFGRAKDMGSAAVTLGIALAMLVWALVLADVAT